MGGTRTREAAEAAAERLGRAAQGREGQWALSGGPLGTARGSESWLCPVRAEKPWAGHFSILGLRFPISKMGIMMPPTYSGHLRRLNKGTEALLTHVTLMRRGSLGMEKSVDNFKRCLRPALGRTWCRSGCGG